MNNDIITIIPARGGSKGIPGKNIKLFNEISLMEEREKLFYLPKQSPM